MDILTVCVTFISLLLGIAYPILIQITSEDKYSSDAILDLFDCDKRKTFFLKNLIASLILIIIVFLRIPPFFSFDIVYLDWVIDNSAIILLSISTVFLVINFFGLINLIQVFYRTSRLIEYLEKKKGEIIQENDFISFEGMVDILFWSMQNTNLKAAKKISDYFSHIFSNYRQHWSRSKDTENEGLIYPNLFYQAINNIIEQSIKNEDKSFKFIEVRASGSMWLLGEFDSPKISSTTYFWIWHNIVLAVNNNRNDLVFMHWKSAHQFFKFNLRSIMPKHSYQGEKLVLLNKAEVDEREKERESFLEFHYALGGLLLYMGEMKFIGKLFEYTTNQPPDSPLLPSNLNEVFQMFNRFLDPNNIYFPWITTKYYFPDIGGIEGERTVKNGVCKYIGVLFIRQYNILTYYTDQDPTAFPTLPSYGPEKRRWAENVGYFKEIIKEISSNENLLTDFGFDTKIDYVSKIEEIEKEINKSLEEDEKNAKPSGEKVNLFYSTVKKVLEPVFESLNRIKNKNEEPDIATKSYKITGSSNIAGKQGFTDSGIEHLNFHSFLPEMVAKNIQENISSIFLVSPADYYYLTQEDVFKAIDKLKITSEDHVIILFGGFDFSYYINNLDIAELSERNKLYAYKGIDIIYFPRSVGNVGTSLFILSKDQLPWIEYEEIEEDRIKLYELEMQIKRYELYASVSDLNTNKPLKKALEEEGGNNKDLEKHVYQGVVFTSNLKFSETLRMVRIQVKGYFDNGRKTHDIGKIKSF